MNGSSTIDASSARCTVGVPPPPLFQLVSVGAMPVAQLMLGHSAAAFVFAIVPVLMKPPNVNRNPVIAWYPAPLTFAAATLASVPRSPEVDAVVIELAAIAITLV